ncbi:MAG TPA: hypothetical protein GX514_03450 [Thermoanaerobacterales bacterium]|uniref:hypothetical protein n=1 Tax=Tepidanaerobacter sp. GT38 TaxID=2722793 RepID=UPI0017E8FC8A|nr:hypothetical protein [Tepidanaerobacter sp. GT38]MCG1012758.1 hypothetical protein [Tepidanaerobacter sp. GT38]HHY41888.1 hypothetical protein [Thermoanaerobacterales bacterium]
MKSQSTNKKAENRRVSKKTVALKGFFKSGENYVPHLSNKEKILARVLEEVNKNKKD